MSTHAPRGSRGPHIVVRETDTYVEHPEDEPPPAPPSRWIRDLFQPVVVSALVACLSLSIAQLIALVTSLEGIVLVRIVPVLMALIGFHTQRVVQARFLSRADHRRFRLVELGMLFLVVKAASHALDTPGELLAHVRGWSADPLTFFDATTLTAFALGVAAWWLAGLTARDLDGISDPGAYVGEIEPAARLITRYAYGGALLLVVTASTRVRPEELIRFEHQRVRSPIPALLAYFLLGMMMLGQIQYARLSSFWRRERVAVAENLAGRWLRYLIVFVALAALIAFVLPTGYTVGILDLIATLMYIVSYIALLLYGLLMLLLWPILMLFSLLMGRDPPTEPPAPIESPLAPPPALGGGGGGAWWLVARSILFWIVLLAAVAFLARSYLRDRPNLFRRLRRLRPWRWLVNVWQAIRSRLRGWGRAVAVAAPSVVRRIFGARAKSRAHERRRARDLREQLRRYYLETLDVAESHGLTRRQTETPYEVRRRLMEHVAEAGPALTKLTEGFVLARYSTRSITPEDVAAQRTYAAQVQEVLARTDAGPDEAP